MRHVWAALGALLLVICVVLVGHPLIQQWEVDQLERIAPTGDDAVVKGTYLTRLALQRPDLLLLMGSSELTVQDEYHAAKIFAGKPTGFSVYLVGSGYRQSIHNFMTLAALGPDLRNKPIVLFISPSWFTKDILASAYLKNFSPVQAYEFAFASSLSPELRQAGARRLLALSSSGVDDPLLRSALHALAVNTPQSRLQLQLIRPLGWLGLHWMRLKDDIDVFRFIIQNRGRVAPVPPQQSKPIDWAALTARASQQAAEQTRSNSYGIIDGYYTRHVQPKLAEIKNSSRSEKWLKSAEFGDLALVLQTLQDLHAKPLFISLPVAGAYADFKGHDPADRAAYYAKVKEMITSAGYPVVDFGPREYEFGFMRDPWHPGWKGALAIDQALDQFYQTVASH